MKTNAEMETNAETKRGLIFVLPPDIENKVVSTIEVGPYNEAGLAAELNKFFNTNIEQLMRINTYLLVHSSNINNITDVTNITLESLINKKPFVDPVIHRATLNESLALALGLPFDYVLQSMLNPGTSDAEGNVALEQALLAVGMKKAGDDIGFYSKQYFLKGMPKIEQLGRISAFLANPKLYIQLIIPKEEYLKGKTLLAPIVLLKPEINVKTYDVANMNDEELLKLNFERKLAASLEELHQFRDMYNDEEFIRKRKEAGLDEKATDVELEVWFGLRSEHCFHKEFNAHITLEDKVNDPVFRTAFEKGWLTKDDRGNYILEKGIFKAFIEEPARGVYEKLEKRGKNWIVSMFEDNSGAVRYNDDFMFCIKFETHNSPSNIEPIQGAKTGIDGVNRDIFGTMLGTFDALANFFFYCTGDPHYKGWLPKGVKHPYVILKGITQGVREGGNESQIPTLGGGIITDPRYIAKCLVYCGTVGWSPIKSPEGISYIGKNQKKGDIILVAGQPVGIDGIHGATESSLSASSYISLGHVQADFSFCQVKMKDFILDAARNMLFSGITDCGAMGISSAYELARDTNGCILDLAKHPKKYSGIQPWQITVSETQDRMIICVEEKNKEEILTKARLHDVEVTELGRFTDLGYIHLTYEGKTVALIDIKKLFDKEPRKRMHATWKGNHSGHLDVIKGDYSLEESLGLVISLSDVASKEWFFRQKDSSVKGATIQGPLIGFKQEVEADATIQKPLDTEGKYKDGKDFGAIAYAMGAAPKVSSIDPYHASQKSFIDMVGKIIAIGGALPDMKNPKWDAWAVCGNYCQPNSDSNTTLIKESGEHNLASLLREAIGVREVIEKTNIPIISGKDSMKCSCVYSIDDSFKMVYVPLALRRHISLMKDEKTGKKKIEIHDSPTYLVSGVVRINDYRKCVSTDFKQNGDLIYVLGTTKKELGASKYYEAVGYGENGAPLEEGKAPTVDIDEFIKIADAIHTAIDKEVVASCKYIHDGGLAVALTKSAIAGGKGIEIDVNDVYRYDYSINDEDILYSETPGRFIVSIAPEDKTKFEQIIGSSNIPYSMIGVVTSEDMSVKRLDNETEHISLKLIKDVYKKPLNFAHGESKI